MTNFESLSRQGAKKIIVDCVGEDVWKEQALIVSSLQEKILACSLQNHPLLSVLREENFELELQKYVHLEFASAFSRPFTGLLLSAMLDTESLQSEQGPLAKMSARFLLGLNLIEELGFTLDPESAEDISTPLKSHYIQLLGAIKMIGVSDEERDCYEASEATQHIVGLIDNARGNLLAELTYLAIAESLFPLFSGLWAQSVVENAGDEAGEGFHSIHVEDEEGINIEDEHSDDVWHLLTQAINEDNKEEVEGYISEWLQAITFFIDNIAKKAQPCGV